MIKTFLIFIVGAGLLACSSVSNIIVNNEQIKVNDSAKNNSHIDSIILPYRSDLDKEMNIVIATSEQNFLQKSEVLNNWVADALLHSQIKNTRLEAPTFCLLNTGGIRSSINKGDVTVGDLFKLMPFDNLVVWVKMPVSSITSIEKYIIAKGIEPISGARLEKGKLIIDGLNDNTTHFWIITSDYLANGGDEMYFFKENISSNITDVLMRDALILEAKEQSVLIRDTTNRIIF